MAARRLSGEGITKFIKLQLSPFLTSSLASSFAHLSHHHAQIKLFFKLFGLITGQFNYMASYLLPDITVVVEIILAYPLMAVNYLIFVEHPAPEIDMI